MSAWGQPPAGIARFRHCRFTSITGMVAPGGGGPRTDMQSASPPPGRCLSRGLSWALANRALSLDPGVYLRAEQGSQSPEVASGEQAHERERRTGRAERRSRDLALSLPIGPRLLPIPATGGGTPMPVGG